MPVYFTLPRTYHAVVSRVEPVKLLVGVYLIGELVRASLQVVEWDCSPSHHLEEVVDRLFSIDVRYLSSAKLDVAVGHGDVKCAAVISALGIITGDGADVGSWVEANDKLEPSPASLGGRRHGTMSLGRYGKTAGGEC